MFLKVEEIHTYYGTSHILFGVSLEVSQGEAVALLGRNGAGKTTTLRSIMGLTPPRQGRIFFRDKDISRAPVHEISRMGMGYVPENRMIFPDLTVMENLMIGVNTRRSGLFTIESAFEIFPRLANMKNRAGGLMSGGEQQMLAIARSLMINPNILLLDEPLEGLSPIVVQEVGHCIMRLKGERALCILLSEQNVGFALLLCERVYIIDKGVIKFHGKTEELRDNEEILQRYLTVHGGGRRRKRKPSPGA
jgi:branched-chain amino acid transport system ATP-binding protein